MSGCLCIAGSQNQAAAIVAMLRRAGIKSGIVPTPRRFAEDEGCSYSVEIPQRYVSSAMDMLRRAGMDNKIICP